MGKNSSMLPLSNNEKELDNINRDNPIKDNNKHLSTNQKVIDNINENNATKENDEESKGSTNGNGGNRRNSMNLSQFESQSNGGQSKGLS